MAEYTIEVRSIVAVENGLSEREGYDKVDELIDNCWDKIFENFPIFDPEYRAVLAKKILRHYYTREICAETVGLWKLWLNNKMNEIMPYYNQLYKSELLEFNPLYDVDYKTTGDREKVETGNSEKNVTGSEETDNKINEVGSGSVSGTSAGNTTDNKSISDSETSKQNGAVRTTNNERDTMNGEKWDLFSDTPQGQLSNVKTGKYLTTAENVEDSETNVKEGSSTSINDNENETTRSTTHDTTNKSEINTNEIRDTENEKIGHEEKSRGSSEIGSKNLNNVEDYFEHVIGKRGSTSYSKMLEEFRKTFLNIDLMIINELKDLFFVLW